MKVLIFVLVSILFSSSQVLADVSNAYRNSNAVVLYDFAETSGNILDKADPKFGAPLNLEIFDTNAATRSVGVLSIDSTNEIRSTGPADKITNTCKASGSMSFEIYLQNNESVEKRAGLDSSERPQPLRIISLSKGLFDRNFVFGQFYDMGNLYATGVSTSKNEMGANNKGNSLKDPLFSKVSATLVPNPSLVAQKIIFTINPSGVARLYLSDRNGNMYLAETNTTGFGSDAASQFFSTWSSGAYLSLGNESMSLTDFTSWRSKSAFFQGCDATRNASDKCFTNPNRYWKGKIYKLAIYCNEIPKDVVLGASVSNIIQNSTFDIDLNVRTTPNRLRAQEIYSRIAGVKTPITNPVLTEMESLLNGGDSVGAAGKAVEDPSFLNITVRDFASKMSNRDETINVPLNDFTATVVGFVRDNISAQKLLTSDIVYQADPSKAAVPSDDVDDILRSNNHYEALSTGRYDLSKVLIQSKQKLYNGKSSIINPYSAGLLTTRQWMSAHAIAGTNRRLVEFSLREFACRPIDTVADASGPDNVVGVDIDRFPGGSHTKFTTTCRACHTIMDGFRPAFARWTFSNNFTKNALVVAKIPDTDDETTSLGMKMSADKIAYKMNQNSSVFPEGRIVVDENWVNNANRGSNAISFKWTKLSGQGTKEFGQALVEAKTFPRCMAERVFKQVCKRAPANSDDDMLTKVSAEFASPEKAYSLKYLFQRIVTTDECLGGPQ